MNPVGYARRWLGLTLHGKVALLTGAGGGIGAELALALASEGVHLCLTDRGASELNRTQAACVQAGGGAARVITVVADLMVREQREALVQECEAQFGHIDFLINNGVWRARACAAGHGNER
jgi:short-subunit dehydrogenase